MFGFRKIPRKEKNDKENIFLYIWFHYRKHERKLNIITICYKFMHLKLFNVYIMGKNKWNEFEEGYKK